MSKTSLSTVLGLAIAVAVAVQLEPALRLGVLMGASLGAAVGLLGSAWLLHAVRTRPADALRATAVGFLFHLVALLLGSLSVRFAPVVRDVADVRGFAVAYAAIAYIPLVLGAGAGARVLSQRSAA